MMMRYGIIAGALFLCVWIFAEMHVGIHEQNYEIDEEGSHEEIFTVLDTEVTADAWALFDPQTGKILAHKNLDAVYPIASITKLFTGAIVLESEKQDIEIRIEATDVASLGRAGKLVEGATTTPYKLLFPLLLESSNDAATAIKRSLGVSYEERLQNILTDLNLKSTHLYDSSGLDARDVSSVQDLITVYMYLQNQHPHLLDITRLPLYLDEDTGYVNNNPLVKHSAFRGGKHGFTDEAQYTYIGTFERNGSGVGIVLLKSEDIFADSSALYKARYQQ